MHQQSPESWHIQCQEREISASKAAEHKLCKNFRIQECARSVTRSNTHMFRRKGGLVNLKRNRRSSYSHLLTLQRWCTSNFLLEASWWLEHHGFLLRASSGSNRSSQGRNCSGLLFWLIIVTTRKLFNIKTKRRIKDRNTWGRRWNKLTSQVTQTFQGQSLR
jgi:hypothetical protein